MRSRSLFSFGSSRRPFAIFAIAATAAALVVLGIDCSIVVRHLGVAYKIGWTAQSRAGRFYVDGVDPSGPAAGKLSPGDRIIAIDGDTRVQYARPDLKLRFLPRDRTYEVRAERKGRAVVAALPFVRLSHDAAARPFPEFDLEAGDRGLADLLTFTAVALAYLALGLVMALSNPDSRVVRSCFLGAVAVAFQMLGLEIVAVISGLRGWELTFASTTMFLFSPFHFALGYDFLSRFPNGAPAPGVWSWARIAFYVYAVPEAIVFTSIRVLSNSNQNVALAAFVRLRPMFDLWTGGRQIRLAFYSSICVAMVAVLVRNYVAETDVVGRRRLRWVIAGLITGLTPMALLGLLFGRAGLANNESLVTISNLFAVAIPASLAYAIAKHRVLGVSVVVRRGLQYLLARNALRALLLIPVAVIALDIVLHPNRPVADILFRQSSVFYAFLAITLVLLGYRKQVALWLDRKFFREAYDRERILADLLEHVKQVDDLAALAGLVTQRLDAALHPACVQALFCEDRAAALTRVDSDAAPTVEIGVTPNRPLLRALQGRAEAFEPTRDGPSSLPAEELDWLAQRHIELVVPIAAMSRRVDGVLLLGEKKSEEPYTNADRNLLQAVAVQIAVVYENIALRNRVAHDQKVRTEVLAHLGRRQVNILKECPFCRVCFDSTLDRCPQDGIELVLTLPVERTLEGKYRLDRLLGKGGMGAVYAAMDVRLDRAVAVKIMIGSFFGNAAALRRFDREAQACARLNHPNITSIYDFGGIGESGAFLVMEQLAGRTLRQEMLRRSLLDSATASEWFDELLEGVKAAHAAGVIHRDLKPENVFIAESASGVACVKILDFGLAKFKTDESVLTASGAVLGTFGYMSPEQLVGKEVDFRSDIFSLAVMLVEALTGQRPFEGTTYPELLGAMHRGAAHLAGDASEVRHLDEILQRCLSLDRERRFATVGELQHAVIPVLRECPPLIQLATAASKA